MIPSSFAKQESAVLGREELFKRLLVPFWLRPESALWYAHEAFLAREFLALPLKSPSLELGCMDGASTFVMLGGEFEPQFDVYSPFSGKISLKIMPPSKFNIGMTWEKTHLEKAGKLEIYSKVVEQDLNQPFTDLSEESFLTIWGPNLYWVDNLEGLLQEVRKRLDPAGHFVTVLPDAEALNHTLYRFKDKTDAGWIKDLDRGRHQHIARQAKTLQQWERVFDKAGFVIANYQGYISKLIFQVNDIGLRPLFPVLAETYETLKKASPQDFIRIKQHWIDTVYHFLAPLCREHSMSQSGSHNLWHIFDLRPRS